MTLFSPCDVFVMLLRYTPESLAGSGAAQLSRRPAPSSARHGRNAGRHDVERCGGVDAPASAARSVRPQQINTHLAITLSEVKSSSTASWAAPLAAVLRRKQAIFCRKGEAARQAGGIGWPPQTPCATMPPRYLSTPMTNGRSATSSGQLQRQQ